MGDSMLLIERWIATMPFQTSRRRMKDKKARRMVAGGAVGKVRWRGRGKSEAEISMM
jgi:hypothetical protein